MNSWHNVYGGISRRFQGSCTVKTRGISIDGLFECIQTHEGAILLRVECEATQEMLPKVKNQGDLRETYEVSGTTAGGESFSATPYAARNKELQIKDGKASVILTFGVTEATIGSPQARAKRRRFGITNLEFAPTHVKRGKRRLIESMPIVFDGEEVVVRPIKNHSEIRRLLREQHGIAVTCTADTRASDQSMEMLCHLLSLAHGGIINWIWREDFDGNRRIRTHLTNRITRPFTSLHVIPVENQGSLPKFVELVEGEFRKAFDDYRLQAIIRLMGEVRDGHNSDLEARGTLLISILELLVGSYARVNGIAYRMPPKHFERGRKVWKAPVREAFTKAYPEREDIDEMLTVTKAALERSTLRYRMLSMAKELRLPAGKQALSKQVDFIIKVRNQLVHEGRYPTRPKPFLSFFRLLTFTDRLLLRLIGYSGEHLAFDGKQLAVEKV